MSVSANQRAAEVARNSYGKLLAILSKQTGDIASAEDALAEAFARAMETWSERGIPDKPEAWLLTTSRNKLRDQYKSAAFKTNVSLDDENSVEPVMNDLDPHEIPDERLRLLFVCAHPAIDEQIRTPMMLQTVLGLDAKQIAGAFLVPAATMAQRLVRAKTKIKTARIPFAIPDKSQMPERLDAVLEAIYGTYAIDWDIPNSTLDLTREALFLSDLLVELLPTEAEVLGLCSLLNYSISRKTNSEKFVPLHKQNPHEWNAQRANRADNLLARAKEQNQLGRFQLEAAIQSIHANRRKIGTTNWPAIVQLYQGLLSIAPTIGAAVAMAAALGEAFNANTGLQSLDSIPAESVEKHQPYWATRAHLLSKTGDHLNARKAFDRAISLSKVQQITTYLEEEKAKLN